MTKIAITGAAGRMGQRLVALAKQDGGFEIVAGIGPIGVPITYDLRPTPDVLIDFTLPPSTRHWLKTCRDRGIAMVVGTTGLEEKDHATLDIAAQHIAIMQAPNMSLGVNLLFK